LPLWIYPNFSKKCFSTSEKHECRHAKGIDRFDHEIWGIFNFTSPIQPLAITFKYSCQIKIAVNLALVSGIKTGLILVKAVPLQL
jgi:hypothetical protein